jgi:protein-S-isoprenylcysteine O-methyltransferase Ste14
MEDVTSVHTVQSQLVRQGRWLFTKRSVLPVPLLLALATWTYAHAPAHQDTFGHYAWEVLCLLVGLIGLAIRVWSVGYAPPGTSGRSTRAPRAEELSRSGPYSLVRHPLYVGNFLMWMGVALFPRSVLWALVSGAYFWFCYERIMAAEESFLEHRFGGAFRQWAAATPALIPRWANWAPPSMRFSWKAAAGREYPGMLGLIAALFLLELAEEAGEAGALSMDTLWIFLISGTVALAIVARWLKRHTGFLRRHG